MTRRIVMRLGTSVLGLGVLLSVTTAPAAAQSRREMQMMADLRMLQEQTQLLQQQLTSAIEQLTSTLKTINGRIDEQNAQTRKSFADQKLAVDQFGSDLRVVRERIDENTVRITTLSQEVEALRLAMPQMTAPPPSVPGDPNAGTPGDPTAPATAPVALAPGMTPQRLYNTALADFTAGQWALCIEGFNTYLRNFARTELGDDAQWYVGECHHQDGKFSEAIDAYNRVIANYPKGDRVPDAYYKRGIALSAMGQTDRARESFEQLMKLYPDHDMARMAKQQVDRLNRSKPRG
ncbi:MAG TPA: tetratricopeptide repeat protein [Vicinamibacterales bacterium]|nr:tetratricopeptide repeat protein [Vicinamibacterales bacterium]